jgi:hypothetical protein
MLFLGRIVSQNRVLSTGLAAAVLIEYNAYGTRSATTEPWRPFSNPKPPTSPPRSAPTAASVFAAVFSIIGLWPLMRHDTPHRWALGIAVAFALAALAAPHLLHPLNRAWMAFGRLLHACRPLSAAQRRRFTWGGFLPVRNDVPRGTMDEVRSHVRLDLPFV